MISYQDFLGLNPRNGNGDFTSTVWWCLDDIINGNMAGQ